MILGASSGRLDDEASYSGVETVDVACSSRRYVNLFVELYKPGSADAAASEFLATYDSGGDRQTARIRVGFGLN